MNGHDWSPVAPPNIGHRSFNDIPAQTARDQQKWAPVLRPIARQLIEERMIFSPNRSHFGGSCAREISLDQALHALLESSLQLRPFAVEYGEHDGIANVTGPGKTVPAQDTFPDGAQLGHGRLTALVTRIDLELYTHRAAVKGVVQHQQFRLRIGGTAADGRMEERGSDRYAALAQKLGVVSRHPDHTIIAASPDRVRHSLAGRGATSRGPIGIKAIAHRIDRHDCPGIRIAIHRRADFRLEVGRERLQTQERACQRDIFQLYVAISISEAPTIFQLKPS